MCGIAGIIGKKEENFSESEVLNAFSSLKHRGPDHSAHCWEEELFLGHHRLSIIDPDPRSNQPFTDKDNRYSLVFNGEIFNFKELAEDLKKQGVQLITGSDTEVLFHLLIREKENCLNNLRGFFSFCFYDRKEKSALLARDRFGEKPLYFSKQEDQLLFSSELGFIAGLLKEKKIDGESLAIYLQLSYLPAPFSILQGVRKLMPGECLILENKEIRIQKYYVDDVEKANHRPKKELPEILREAVAYRMTSDVPLCTFLSGGIDSALITGLAKERQKSITAFTIAFPDDPYLNEADLAKETAHKLKVDLETIAFSRKALEEVPYILFDELSEPFADSSALALRLLTEEVGKKFKVALSGDGADELFGGYNKHRAEWIIRHQKRTILLSKIAKPFSALFPSGRQGISNKVRQLQRLNSAAGLSDMDRYLFLASFMSSDEVNQVLANHIDSKKALISKTGLLSPHTLQEVLENDIRLVLQGDMLQKTDLMSMAGGMEIRSPFLDHTVVEYARSISIEKKITAQGGKMILKESFPEILDQEIIGRKKRGFEVPLERLLCGTLKKEVEEHLLNSAFIRKQGLFNVDGLQHMLNGFPNSLKNANAIWSLLVFQKWYKKWMA